MEYSGGETSTLCQPDVSASPCVQCAKLLPTAPVLEKYEKLHHHFSVNPQWGSPWRRKNVEKKMPRSVELPQTEAVFAE